MYKAQYAFNVSMIMCPAVHMATRSLLRSSSTHEPSDPLSRVKILIQFYIAYNTLVISTGSQDIGTQHASAMASSAWGYSGLPWRSPLGINNTDNRRLSGRMRIPRIFVLTYKYSHTHMITFFPFLHQDKGSYNIHSMSSLA